MKLLLLVVLPIFALAEEEPKQNLRAARRLPAIADTEGPARRLPHITTFDASHIADTAAKLELDNIDVDYKTTSHTYDPSSHTYDPNGFPVSEYNPTRPPMHEFPVSEYNPTRSPLPELLEHLEHLKYDKRDQRQGLPRKVKPDQCATGTVGNYRPREGTSNCSKTKKKEKSNAIEVDDDVVSDPRRPIFPDNQPGWYEVKIRCTDLNYEHDINLWFEAKEFDSIEKEILESWDKESKHHAGNNETGAVPISTPSHDERRRLGEPQQCMVALEDPCNEARRAACELQDEAIGKEKRNGDAHAELIHRVSEYLECTNRHQSRGFTPCERNADGTSAEKDQAYAGFNHWDEKYVESLHLHTLMPSGINIVPNGGGAAPVSEETDACIDFSLETMCRSRAPCGQDGRADCDCNGKLCSVETYCKYYRGTARPRVIHQEGGTGVPHTNSNGNFVADECVDPNATWIVLLWDADQTNSKVPTPPKGSLTVFGCPSRSYEGCGSKKKCLENQELPFTSWKGWITSSPIHRTDAAETGLKQPQFCTLWHTQKHVGELFNRNDDPILDDPTGYHAQGYLQPEVCYQSENPTPFDKCTNLSPDNCHFKEGTKFDPKYGQFYHDSNFQIDKWWWPRWGDNLDWRRMLPVCFGCDFEQCGASGSDKDNGQGTCDSIGHNYKDAAGSKFMSPLWFKEGLARSPLQQMTSPSGESVVRDQGSCGSCWAFASMTTASHLTCIADCKENGRCLYDNIMSGSNFLDPFQLSAQSILSCNSQQAGCNGGWMRYGDEVYENFGVMKEKNFPYKQAAAKDSANGAYTGNSNLISSGDDYYGYVCKTGSCQSTVNVDDGSSSCNGGSPAVGDWDVTTGHSNICQNQWGAKCPYSWDYWQYPASSGWAEHTGVYNLKRVAVHGWYNVASGSNWEHQYKEHLYNVGPFGVAFDVYSDFPWNGCSATDSDHVYAVGSSATKRGGHGVTMVGYGWAYNVCEPDGASSCTAASGCVKGWVKYWLLQNSWGRSWGQGGYWKHRRGTDEARIESWAATAPEVDVNCNDSNDYYGGSINYPKNTWKKAVPASMEKFVNLMEQVKPKPPKSDTCPGASWDPKNRNSIGGFQIVHSISDVTKA